MNILMNVIPAPDHLESTCIYPKSLSKRSNTKGLNSPCSSQEIVHAATLSNGRFW